MPEEKKMTKKAAGWKKPTCNKFGFRTCGLGICDHFEMDA